MPANIMQIHVTEQENKKREFLSACSGSNAKKLDCSSQGFGNFIQKIAGNELTTLIYVLSLLEWII